MGAATTETHNVHTTLNFYLPTEDGSPPAPAYMARPETFERPRDKREVIIQDVSGNESAYTLERDGFQYITAPSKERDFVDPERVTGQYYEDIEQLVKDMTGATRVYIFDHTIRRPSKKQVQQTEGNGLASHDAEKQTPRAIPPTFSVHIDQSYESALSRVSFHLPDDAERLLKGRVQLLNIWRPIKTVKRDPLTIAPSRSIEDDDLVAIPVIYPHGNRVGATMSLKYNQEQLWFYKWHQKPEEALVFKCFDNWRKQRVPHSAFEIPGTEDEEERESIEVRCLAFHEENV